MNSGNSKTPDHHRLLFTDSYSIFQIKWNEREGENILLYQTLAFTIQK